MSVSKQIEAFVALKPRARTIKEIATELGMKPKEVEKLLMDPSMPKGYELTHWRNHLNEVHYQILPPEEPRPSPLPRAFRMERAAAPESYLRVFIPDDILDVDGKPAEYIELWPFSDVHWGHKRCDRKNYLRDVKEVARRPNRFAILNGDNAENSLGDSAGGAAWAEQKNNPHEQRFQLEEVNRPIAHKILSATPGNHEGRSTKKTLMNMLEEICKGIDVPYFAGPYNLEVVWRGYRWTFHIKHGNGGGGTPGGKLNSAGRDRSYNDFRNFFVSGHVHDEMTHKVMRAIRRREFDDEGNLIRFWKEYAKEYKVICPAYLLYSGTYAEEAGYSPGSRNTIRMQMFANGDYRVISSKRGASGDAAEPLNDEI